MAINMLAPEDQKLFWKYGIGPELTSPFSLVHKAFEHQVDTQPHCVAVEDGEIALTYAELEERSNILANRLISNGLRPRGRVLLVAQRSFHFVVGILAILKCGCQYVPLDGGVVPKNSIAHIVKDTAASTVLTLSKFTEMIQRVTSQNISVVTLDDNQDLSAVKNTKRPNIDVSNRDGAYIIYTSGSTGPPKGVDVSHENVTNLLCLAPGNLGIKRGTLVTQLLSVSFDMGQWEILGTLTKGGTLLLRGSDWSKVLKRANTIIATPSILATIKKSAYPNITTVALAGEPCPITLADQWSENCTLYTCCGPSEVTIVNTMSIHVVGNPICIGKPVPNTSVYVLDEFENPVPIGKPGIMWVGGKCVSRGYLNLPQATAARYKIDRFREDGSYMFNTGDLGRWQNDGSLEIFGRLDDQVKIKGFRVELNSVTIAIESVAGVEKACAMISEDILWGFYSAVSRIDDLTLQSAVGKLQPYYAVPTRWEYRETLPLTSNGKIDKRWLLQSLDETPKLNITLPEAALIRYEKKEVMTESINETSSQSESDSKPEEDWIVPPKHGIHGLRALRHRIFSLYRRFFSFVLLGNIIAIVVTVRFGPEGKALESLGLATATNLTISVLMRQDHVVNLLFNIFCAVPVSWPIWIRRNCAKVYHIGGLHSGCAIAATVWLFLFSIAGTIMHASAQVQVVSYLILALLLTICISAHPTFRAKMHNRFELIHRFAGWTALGLFWLQTIFVVDYVRPHTTSLGTAFARSPVVWLLTVTTASIILPWLNLRRVTVRPDVLSTHAVRLYFNYTTPVVGTAVRLSASPLTEWHAFATIAKPNEKGFSLLVSNAGDWTSHTIRTAPTKMWVRGVPACGVLRIAPLFKSIVLVATGSGIGPCLPVIYAKRVPARIFWSTPRPDATFGGEIIRAIKDADANAVIHDTKTQGRPDMVKITWGLLKESGAEAVCVISNKKLTQMIVYAMEARGVPAFGAIFDS